MEAQEEIRNLLTKCNLLKGELITLKSIIIAIDSLYLQYPEDSIKILLKKAKEIIYQEQGLGQFNYFINFEKRKYELKE